MIAVRRLQRNFADGFIAEAVEDLWEPWMRHADQALEDDALLLIIQQELAKRCKKSMTRGRKATPADVVLRMLLLKHVRDWSYETLSREVRANLVYREFTRIGGEKVPDDRTMGNLARQLGPEVIEKLHRRVVEIAQENKIATGQKMRVDTTVVETDIHYPTDSTLLGDGVRVLTRIMKKVTTVAGKAGTQMRDRNRSAKLKVLAIARASRNKTEQGRQKMKNAYVKLLEVTSRVAGQAKKFSSEIAAGVKRGNLSVLHKAKQQLDEMIPRVQQVLRQTRERVLRGNTQADGKLLRRPIRCAAFGRRFLSRSGLQPDSRVTRRATALERRLSPGMPRAYLRRLLSRQSCYCFAALDRPDRLETALFGNRGTT